MDETRGFGCLEHSKWNICIPLSQFLTVKFFLCLIFILGGQFLLPLRATSGNREFSQLKKWRRQAGFCCLGHSNWIICISLSPFCSGQFQFVSPLYWKANQSHTGPRICKIRWQLRWFRNGKSIFEVGWLRSHDSWLYRGLRIVAAPRLPAPCVIYLIFTSVSARQWMTIGLLWNMSK